MLPQIVCLSCGYHRTWPTLLEALADGHRGRLAGRDRVDAGAGRHDPHLGGAGQRRAAGDAAIAAEESAGMMKRRLPLIDFGST